MLPGTGGGAGEGQTAQGSALGPDWTSSLTMKGAAKVLNQLDYVVDYLQLLFVRNGFDPQRIVPQIFKLLPMRHICFDLVIRFITNRKYAFFCIF